MQPERAAELVAVWTAEAIAQHITATGKAIDDATAPILARLAEAEARAIAAEEQAEALEGAARALRGALDAIEAAQGDIVAEAVAPLLARLADAEGRLADIDESLNIAAKATLDRIEREAEAAETLIVNLGARLAQVEARADDGIDGLAARLAAVEAIEPIPGPAGADGLDRPIVDMVASWRDDTESLPRGVLLADDAGLFMATREAHGPPAAEPSSWRCLAAGLRIEASDYEGDRRLIWQARSGHELVELPIALPVPIHRGLWDADADYAEHDLCTWDGAVWRALGDLPAGSPAGTMPPDDPASSWGIYSPRGKTGRPGKDGGRGLPGERGRGIAQVLGTIVDGAMLIELDDGEIARVDLTPLVETITDALKEAAK